MSWCHRLYPGVHVGRRSTGERLGLAPCLFAPRQPVRAAVVRRRGDGEPVFQILHHDGQRRKAFAVLRGELGHAALDRGAHLGPAQQRRRLLGRHLPVVIAHPITGSEVGTGSVAVRRVFVHEASLTARQVRQGGGGRVGSCCGHGAIGKHGRQVGARFPYPSLTMYTPRPSAEGEPPGAPIRPTGAVGAASGRDTQPRSPPTGNAGNDGNASHALHAPYAAYPRPKISGVGADAEGVGAVGDIAIVARIAATLIPGPRPYPRAAQYFHGSSPRVRRQFIPRERNLPPAAHLEQLILPVGVEHLDVA